MKSVSSATMRELDRAAIDDYEIPGELLMERAGQGVADVVDDLARLSGFNTAPIRLIAGRGNNGGDVFVAARLLKELDYQVDVWLAGDRGKIKGDALTHLEKMRAAGITLNALSTPGEWEDLLITAPGDVGVVVDGVLGTGLTGPARGAAAGAIQYINALGERAPVVSVDIPSGLNADTGEVMGDTVRADITVTMGLPKTGLLLPAALDYVGSVDVVDIGLPEEIVRPLSSPINLIAAEDLRPILQRRPRDSHKGTYGHLLVIGGAPGYTGAAILAARAALRSGVGLVSMLVPASLASTVAGAVPEAMVHAGVQTDSGGLADDAVSSWNHRLDEFSAVVMGPGLSTDKRTCDLVHHVIRYCSKPLLLDADALNAVGIRLHALKKSPAPIVVTPHPGEMARLLGTTVTEVQADRLKYAALAVEKTGATVVLKGAGTIVASPNDPLHVNLTGNPGMARGGMGDVLAGLLGGLLAQGHGPADAARLAVYLHGRAGDRVAWSTSQSGMSVQDVIDALAGSFGELAPR
ncbi:MAG: NAD(P)H-hydrate dehydratase [Verrucomicrobia bacterium]|nr:NAD(P)H-hydrate dehydratase [Verrucomicrobiota bacterium]